MQNAEVQAEFSAMKEVAGALLALVGKETRRAFAKRVGLTEGRVSQLLAELSNPSIKTLARIAHRAGYRLRVSFEPLPDGVAKEHAPYCRCRSCE